MYTRILMASEGAEVRLLAPILLIAMPVLIMFTLLIFFVTRYRRCPSNKVLVVFGKIGGMRTSQCLHGGGTMVWPIVQDYAYLSLEPRTVEADLGEALALKDLSEGTTATVTFAISTKPDLLQHAAERLLGLPDDQVESTAKELVVGTVRDTFAGLPVEALGRDREKHVALLTKELRAALAPIGLEVVGVNVPVLPVPSSSY